MCGEHRRDARRMVSVTELTAQVPAPSTIVWLRLQRAGAWLFNEVTDSRLYPGTTQTAP